MNSSSAANLILYDSGTDRYLKKYSDTDQDQWVEWIAVEEECEQEITLSSTHSKFYTSPEGEIRGVRVYTQDDDTLEKYYLKMDVLTYEVTLECEEAYLNVSNSRNTNVLSFSSYVLLFPEFNAHTEAVSFRSSWSTRIHHFGKLVILFSNIHLIFVCIECHNVFISITGYSNSPQVIKSFLM